MIFTPVLRILGGNSHSLDFLYFLNICSCMQSQVQQILTKIQKIYPMNIKRTIYNISKTQVNRLPLCNIKEKTLFKFDRYWDERPLGWKHFKRQQCFRLRTVWAQFMTKALHNKIYISIWCNVVLESSVCQMVYFFVT